METSKPTFWIALTALVVAAGCFVVLLIDQGSSPDRQNAGSGSPAVSTPASPPAGATGQTGARGAKGSPGVTEAIVAEGPAGPRGKTGAAGPAGSVGAAGAAGATGPQGCEGPSGPRGPTGETGSAGCQGPQGQAGASGAAGPAGPQGIAGADGRTILNGSGPPPDTQGAVGDFYIDTAANEIYGPKAKDGWGVGTSEVGPEGPQGEAGPQGSQGDTGPQGSQGPAGKSVLSGPGAPAPSLGSDGDFYIEVSTNQIYGPKTSSSWGSAVSLVGPQGPAGATGAQGPQGVQGPPGVDAANVPLYRGSFYSTGDESPTGGTNVVPINLNETDISQGVELVSPGTAAVKVVHAGTYNFQFSAQVTKTDSGTDVLYIWPQVDPDGAGTNYTWQNVPWANSGITLFAKDDRAIPAWNFVLPVDDGAYFRMVMSSTNTGFIVDSTTAPPVGPAIPGLILTVTRAG